MANKRNCIPRSAAVPSQSTLFEPWPKSQLEPYGNPAYEGVGYPSAGYGQSRRKVVPLALPKVAAPQLTNKGWEGKVPQGTIVTVGTLNPKSAAFSRGEIASLAGLGCNCSKTDQRMGNALRGLAAIQLGPVQKLANDIANGIVPGDVLQDFVNKILADERSNAKAYHYIESLAKLDPANSQLSQLRTEQQKSWGQTNTAKFYAFLLPVVRERLIGKVTLPDYKYVRSGGDGGVFTMVAKFLQEKTVGDAAQQLIQQGYMKDSGLAGLGAPVALIGAVGAGILAAGIFAYMASQVAKVVETNSRNAAIAACQKGTLSDAACIAAIEGATSKATDWTAVAKYGAIGLGALVALQVIGSIRSAFPSR